MAVVCPSCGTENLDSAKFCSECAAPIALKARSRESRRTVTILFADVSGSSSLGEQLDPESMRALMGRYFAEIRTRPRLTLKPCSIINDTEITLPFGGPSGSPVPPRQSRRG